MPKNEPILRSEQARACLQHVVHAVDFIEQKLEEQPQDEHLSLESIATAVALSPFHLHRLFSGLTGIPLIQYVRERRLSRSAEMLHSSDRPILDIALSFGYEHEQSYIRAFRKCYGVSPARSRRQRAELPLFERLDVDEILAVGDGLLVQPVFVMRSAFALMGTQVRIFRETEVQNATANRHGLAFMQSDARRIPNPVSRTVYFGLVDELPDAPGYSDYLSALEVAYHAPAIAGMIVRRFPPMRCGIVRYVGLHAPQLLNYEKLLDIKNTIRSRWLSRSSSGASARVASGWHLERIDEQHCTADYCEASLIFPV